MEYKVKRKQPNSKMCLVCGLANPFGLKGSFYEMENDELVFLFTPIKEHQGYPERLHGGLISAVLDETIGRAIMARHDSDLWGVTLELTTRFKKPIPLNVELKVVSRITKEQNRYFEGTGEIILPDGDIGASGQGKYLKLPIEEIADFDPVEQSWEIVSKDNDPESIDI